MNNPVQLTIFRSNWIWLYKFLISINLSSLPSPLPFLGCFTTGIDYENNFKKRINNINGPSLIIDLTYYITEIK